MKGIADNFAKYQTKTAFRRAGGKIYNGAQTLFGRDFSMLDQNACIFCFRKMKFAPSKNLYYCKGTKKAPHKSFAIKLKNNLT